MHRQWIVACVASAGWHYKAAWRADRESSSYKIQCQKSLTILRVTGYLGRHLLDDNQLVNDQYQAIGWILNQHQSSLIK